VHFSTHFNTLFSLNSARTLTHFIFAVNVRNSDGLFKYKCVLLCAEYLLAVNPDERPDIFQASYVAFEIGGWPCPVHNLHVCWFHCCL